MCRKHGLRKKNAGVFAQGLQLIEFGIVLTHVIEHLAQFQFLRRFLQVPARKTAKALFQKREFGVSEL